MKSSVLAAAIALLSATAVEAQPRLDLKSIVASVDADTMDFTSSYGKWRTVNARSQIKAGGTRIDMSLSRGSRAANDGITTAARAQVSVAHDWTPTLATRSYGTLASRSPVFVNREVGQDVNFKPVASTVLTAGTRYSQYFGGADSWSWSLGASRYFPGGFVSYRFSSYDTKNLGNTTGHVIGAKLNDPYGATQAWVGFGTSLNDVDWLSSPQKGHQTVIELRRLQPIGHGISLSLGAKHAWIQSGDGRYEGSGVHFGIQLHPSIEQQAAVVD